MKGRSKKGESADVIRRMLVSLTCRGTDKEWEELRKIKQLIATSKKMTIREIEELGDLFLQVKVKSGKNRIGEIMKRVNCTHNDYTLARLDLLANEVHSDPDLAAVLRSA